MTCQTPIETTNLDIYGQTAIDWKGPFDLLVAGPSAPDTTFFLNTARPDGRPHSAPFGALWIDESFYIVSGPETRKSKNLAANPACTVTVGLKVMDMVLEGSAERVTDAATLERSAKAYCDHGWPAEVDADAEAFTAPYSAPSAGPPPWYLYRFTFYTAFAVGEVGATRWRFEG